MKRTNFILTGMFLVTSLMSCGGSSEKATDENEVIVVDTISEGTAAVEDTVTSEDAETAVEEDVKEVVHNPKYDKILDEMEEKIRELSEKSKKGDAGVLELQRLQLKVTKLMDKVKMLFSQIIPPSLSPTESKSLFFISVSLLLSRI